jgi:hypothetical protein
VVFSYLRDDFSEDDDHGLQRKKSPSGPQPPRFMLEREISQLTVETRTAAIPPPRTLSKKIGSDSLTICTSSHRAFVPTSQIMSLPSKSKSSDEHVNQTKHREMPGNSSWRPLLLTTLPNNKTTRTQCLPRWSNLRTFEACFFSDGSEDDWARTRRCMSSEPIRARVRLECMDET